MGPHRSISTEYIELPGRRNCQLRLSLYREFPVVILMWHYCADSLGHALSLASKYGKINKNAELLDA